jgi:PAS domain S-box-containing protein
MKKKAEILIVEDSATQAEQLTHALEGAGYSVAVAADGEQALAAAKRRRPSLIVSDILMPVMDGYAMCKALRNEDALKSIPVILLTTLSDPQDVIRGIDAGVDYYFTKPYPPEALLSKIQSVLGSPVPREIDEVDEDFLVTLAGGPWTVKSSRRRVINLLLSTYENAVRQNGELFRTQGELRSLNERLEEIVEERTARARHLNIVLRAIRNVNQLIVHEKDRSQLIRKACGLLVETRGYHHAWILLTAEDGSVSAAECGGPEAACAGFVRAVEGHYRPTCLGKASDSTEGLVILDPVSDCAADCPLRGTCGDSYAAVSVMRHDGRALGFLGMSIPNNSASDTEEQSLIFEVAGDLAFAVYGIESELRRRESDERFRVGFEKGAVGQALISPEGRFLMVNEAFAGMVGYKADALKGRSFIEITYPDDREKSAESMKVLLSGDEALRFEKRFLRPDGGVVWVDVNDALVRDSRGRPLHVVTTYVDITERKRAEDELKSTTQALWQAAKLVTMGELAASVAHELNNPLATVSLSIESLQAGLPEGDQRRQSLGIVEKEIDRMARLVADLLQFSRRSQAQISTVDVRDEIEKTLDFIHYHLRNKKIEARKDFSPEVRPVLADRQQLRQVFLNLFSNAVDAMPRGGTLTIRVYMADSSSRVVCEIEDTGPGIPPEVLSKTMEPFFTTKAEGKGTGLGLPICRRIVQEHRGTLLISSEVGRGTTVSISLPASDAKPPHG